MRSTLVGHGWSHTILNSFGFDRNQNPEHPSQLYGPGNYEWGGRIVPYESGATFPAE